jgi:uncharacterized damage-inducible protein DinB
LPTSFDGGLAGDGGSVAVSVADFLWFVDAALDVMAIIVRELGDDLANRRPDLEGANSPYAILTHCLGVMEYWGGATVADRPISRDRAAEFTAHGPVDELLQRAAAARERLEADLEGLDSMAVPPHVHRDPDEPVPYHERKGSVLLHVLEELFQHLGQMELTRDLLLKA